ncbi:MAG: GDSL-type esterase/lipase family protein [Verrucomicrobia bacterium]|nr:GDSL-type esterase/lipase family protein [Verrucomicrobiota bacterium]
MNNPIKTPLLTVVFCLAAQFAFPNHHGDALTLSQQASIALPVSYEGLPGDGPIRGQHEWFQKVWTDRRTSWFNSVEADQGAVVFFGDSITQGWDERLKPSFPGLKVANRGISGDTTRGMLIRLDEDVIALNPSAVVMLMGTNDLADGATPEQISGNVRLIIDALHKHDANLPIILCRIFPSSGEKDRTSEDIQKINEQLAAAVKGDIRITVVDTWTLFANEAGDAKIEEFPDLLHPNDLGYAKWKAALRPVFATLGMMDTGADDFQIEPGFAPLFNGKNLNGWGFKVTPPRKPNNNGIVFSVFNEPENFYGKTVSSDLRFAAINDRLVVTTPAEGRRIQQLWTTRDFPKDFILKLEFRATPNADSGVFLRGKQLQCRDFLLAGPYKDLKKYKQGDWNEIIIKVTGTTAHCTCNGEVLEAAFEIPETGAIGLEGDRGQIEYRRIRIKEM